MKTCRNCDFNKVIYRYPDWPYKTNKRYCTKQERICKNNEVCDSWHHAEQREYNLTPQRFDDAISDLLAIDKILSKNSTI